MALINEKIDGRCLFEGEEDHKLPVTDSTLLRGGLFRMAGKFIAHSIIHTGIGLVGISPAAIEYLTIQDIDEDTPLTITINDIADMDLRRAIQCVSKEQRKSFSKL